MVKKEKGMENGSLVQLAAVFLFLTLPLPCVVKTDEGYFIVENPDVTQCSAPPLPCIL